jgi:hypothetical protein
LEKCALFFLFSSKGKTFLRIAGFPVSTWYVAFSGESEPMVEEGFFMTKKQGGKPAKFKVHERLNPLHPADDVTMEELEGKWGDPKKFKDDISEAELEKIRQRISRRKIKPY